MDSNSCKVISQGSVEDEGCKQVTSRTRRNNLPNSENLTESTGTFYNMYEALELDKQEMRWAKVQTGISETWWEESCDWSALLGGYRLSRRNRQGRRGWGYKG